MPASRAANSAISEAASGWAKRLAASEILASSGRSRNNVAISVTRRSLVSSDLRQEAGRIGFGKGGSVAGLMVVSRGRQWDEDRWLPCRGYLGHGAGSRTAKQQISAGKRPRHVVDKR